MQTFAPRPTIEHYQFLCSVEGSDQSNQLVQVTARCLEALIRLATANAKVRLSGSVDEMDCHAALELLSLGTVFAYDLDHQYA